MIIQRKKQPLFCIFFVPSSLKCKRKAIMYYSSPGAIYILATRWQQCMCKVLDWFNEPLYFCCITTAQMCLICLLITFLFQNCALSFNNSMESAQFWTWKFINKQIRHIWAVLIPHFEQKYNGSLDQYKTLHIHCCHLVAKIWIADGLE